MSAEPTVTSAFLATRLRALLQCASERVPAPRRKQAADDRHRYVDRATPARPVRPKVKPSQAKVENVV
jgi:hypothetical protein